MAVRSPGIPEPPGELPGNVCLHRNYTVVSVKERVTGVKTSAALAFFAIAVLALAGALAGCFRAPATADSETPPDAGGSGGSEGPGPRLDELAPASSYAGRAGAGDQFALVYVDEAGEARASYPWYAPPVGAGKCAEHSRPGWGVEVSAGGVSCPTVICVSPEGAVTSYNGQSESLSQFPVKAPDWGVCSGSLSPSGEWLVLDAVGAADGKVSLLDPVTGEVRLIFDYLVGRSDQPSWVWNPDGTRVAFGKPRRPDPPVGCGSGQTSDLTVLDAGTDESETIVCGDSLHILVPLGWSAEGYLAFYDVKGTGDVLWLNPPSPEPLSDPPALPLAFDRERVRALLPRLLTDAWTGWFRVSPDERFVAVVCRGPSFTPVVCVVTLDDGQWHKVGPGDYPAWSPCPVAVGQP